MIKYLPAIAALYFAFLAVAAYIIYASTEPDARVAHIGGESDPLPVESFRKLEELRLRHFYQLGSVGHLTGRCAPWGTSQRELCIWDEAAI